MYIYHIIQVNKMYLFSNVSTHYINTTTTSPWDESNKINIPKSLV